MTIHPALLLAICAGPAAANIRDFISPQGVNKVVQEVEAKASVEETEILRTLLWARSRWHPNAPQLLHNVLSRTSNVSTPERRLASCHDNKDSATCPKMADKGTECSACKWADGWCTSTTCGSYEDETTCCANAGKVKTGCYWNPHVKSFGKTGECVELGKCDEMARGKCKSSFDTDCPEAQSLCEGLPGCQWNSCGGCQKTGTTCSCTDNGRTCQSSGGDLMGMLMGNTGCAIMDCVMCFKKEQSGDMDMSKKVTCAEYGTRATTYCSSKCSAIVKTTSEAQCLAKDQGMCPQTVAECKAHTPTQSCKTTAPSSSSTDMAQNCMNMCNSVKVKCGNSAMECTASALKSSDQASSAWSQPKHVAVLFASLLGAASLAFQ